MTEEFVAPPQALSGSAAVFRKIKQAILDGIYAYNERLPSERDLSSSFGYARGTIRSALVRLEKAHYVRRKTGSGTYVIYNNQFQRKDIAEETSPIELIETRLAIEPYIVKLVIRNANNRDIRRLEEAVEQLRNAGSDSTKFSTADEAFHLVLSQCSQNPLLIWIYERINDIRSHSQWSARKTKILTEERIRAYNLQHKLLVDAIRQRDHETASNIIHEHLVQARNDLLGSS
jgi:DNA-binding FadR family transcriptional regulator